MKSFLLFIKEDSTLDTTTWSVDDITGSLRELLSSTKESSSVIPVEIEKLWPKTTKWEGEESQKERIRNIDLSHPITVIQDEEGNILSIPDGHHRIHAAKEEGMTHIPSRVIPADALNDKFRRLFL